MKKYHWPIFVVFFISLLITMNVWLYVKNHQKTHFDCHGVLIISNGTSTLNAMASLSLLDNVGELIIDGTVVSKDGKVDTLRRRIVFSFQPKSDGLFLTNGQDSELAGSSASGQVLDGLAPEYLMHNNVNMVMHIRPVGGGAYLIANDKYVVFYCVK